MQGPMCWAMIKDKNVRLSMAIMQCEKCRVRWVFDDATKILSTAKAFDKMLLTERNVKSKCKHISDLKTKPHPEQKTCRSHLTLTKIQCHGLSTWKWMCKAPQGKEKSGAARKRGAYIFFCAAARRRPKNNGRGFRRNPKITRNYKFWQPCNFTLFTTFW